jgi:hypothetical protein
VPIAGKASRIFKKIRFMLMGNRMQQAIVDFPEAQSIPAKSGLIIQQCVKPSGLTAVLMVGIGAAWFEDNAVTAGNQVNQTEIIVSNPPVVSFTPRKTERNE